MSCECSGGADAMRDSSSALDAVVWTQPYVRRITYSTAAIAGASAKVLMKRKITVAQASRGTCSENDISTQQR
jgi:hypothetical protein